MVTLKIQERQVVYSRPHCSSTKSPHPYYRTLFSCSMEMQRGLGWKEYLNLLRPQLLSYLKKKKQGKTTFPLISQIYVVAEYKEASKVTKSTQTVSSAFLQGSYKMPNKEGFMFWWKAPEALCFSFNIPRVLWVNLGLSMKPCLCGNESGWLSAYLLENPQLPAFTNETLLLHFTCLQHWLSGHLLNLLDNDKGMESSACLKSEPGPDMQNCSFVVC